jgi:hypothetical protein
MAGARTWQFFARRREKSSFKSKKILNKSLSHVIYKGAGRVEEGENDFAVRLGLV